MPSLFREGQPLSIHLSMVVPHNSLLLHLEFKMLWLRYVGAFNMCYFPMVVSRRILMQSSNVVHIKCTCRCKIDNSAYSHDQSLFNLMIQGNLKTNILSL